MTVSGGFVLQERTVRVWCDVVDKATGEKPYDGLWADVRRNLTNGERDEFKRAANEIDERAEALTAEQNQINERFTAAVKDAEGDPAEQDRLIREQIATLTAYAERATQIGVDRFTLVAPHVHGWNLQTMNDAGEIVPVPSPREIGAAALAHITPEIVGWLLGATLQAYRAGFPVGSRTSGAPLEPTPEPNAASKPASTSNSRRSRKTSSSPNPSTFEA